MSITCNECNAVFKKMITNTHLKKHGITVAEYKVKYGEDSVVSPDYKAECSEKYKGANNPNFGNKWNDTQKQNLSSKTTGRVPHNKGKKIGTSVNHIEGIAKREERYRTGELTRVRVPASEEKKIKLSISAKKYANENPEEIKARASQAQLTRLKNGSCTAPFLGKKHSSESLQKIAEAARKSNQHKKDKALENRLVRISEANLTCINSSVDSASLNLKCNTCDHSFTLTKQCFTNSKFKAEWCPQCFPVVQQHRSRSEIEIFEYVHGLCPDAIASWKLPGSKKEIDIYIPSKKIAIEFNGLYWHSEQVLEHNGKSKTSDHDKMKLVTSLGIRYIGIFEDEWANKETIVKSRLSHILGSNNSIKLHARKCTITPINSKTASAFCNLYHLQGAGKSNVRLGLYHNDELVAVMTFSNNNLSRKITNWEINRFCIKDGMSVSGGASKLFKYFLVTNNPETVVSYADSRWSQGDVYGSLGFVKERDTVPNYWYVLPNSLKRTHRFALRKTTSDDKNKTEKQIRTEQGYLRIWDCGSSKWIWKRGG